MANCKKCGTEFKTCVLIAGEWKSIQNRKYCLDCSPYKQHNTKRLHLVNPNLKKECTKCSRKFSENGTVCASCRANGRKLEIKRRAMEYKGGKCIHCGYNRCPASLDFHHRNPDEKKFSIGGSHSRAWEQIRLELDKCDLVCSNCHGEIHAGLI